MPIPFLLIGLGVAAGAVGVGKTGKAIYDQHDAKETNESAEAIINKATEDAKLSRKRSSDAIISLGNKKIDILNNSVVPYITLFEKLHNVELAKSAGLEEFQNFKVDKQFFNDLKEMGAVATSILGGVASGAAMGAITAFGAYGAAMTFGAASTGTAIATLSGAAATNATLAFLGGGSLAAGGLGIAGGTAVLGGLVAGPALAIMGFVVGAKASANRDKAYANYAKAKEYREEVKTVCVLCKGIRMRANMFERLLIKLDAIFAPLVYGLEEIIKTSGTDYSKFTPEQKKTVAAGLATVAAIKSVLDTPILTEDGQLTKESEKIAGPVQQLLKENGKNQNV